MAPPIATGTATQTNTNGSIPLLAADPKSEYPFAHLLPVFDKSEHFPPLTPFKHVDPAARANALPEAEQRAFLRNATRVRDLTPKIGREVTGIDLTAIGGAGRDQLALEVARRGVVVFRDQPKFLAQTAEQFKEWGSYFGQLHVHPTSGHPAAIPELHLVYRDGSETFNHEQLNRISTTLWHSDVSYERQPPGLTTFFLLAQRECIQLQPYIASLPSCTSPAPSGGDTAFVSQVQALKKLSPPFVAFLRTLTAVHSGVQQAEYSRSGRRGGVVRRDPVEHGTSLTSSHPVTGEEALYVNQQFTTCIVGLKQEESDNILNFLYNHIARVADAQVRVNWEPNTVVLWDNRVTAHTAIIDFTESGERRHGARITPQAEKPIPALDSLVVP
ncbi:hypothetical protein FRC10_010191 [Ceratobasidium sp. 414]|nr:hypothetical protein FRC10_010191 [Ceratobasidium sp. 414]